MSTASNRKISALRHTLVNAALALVAADKKQFSQSLFPQINEETHICDSPFCMAGFIVQASSPALFKRLCKYSPGFFANGKRASWWGEASKALKLPSSQGVGVYTDDRHYEGASRLFGLAGSWPQPFSERYHKAKTPNQRYLACKARWEDWLKESDKALGI